MVSTLRLFRRFARPLDKGSSRPRHNCRRSSKSRGAAAVEFAIVLPLFLSLVLGMIELGRAIMVMQALTYAAREGCRVAVLDGSTSSGVTAKVDSAMDGANIGLPPAIVSMSPSNPSSAKYDEPVTVTVQVRYGDITWLPIVEFMQPNAMLKASITMRRETVK